MLTLSAGLIWLVGLFNVSAKSLANHGGMSLRVHYQYDPMLFFTLITVITKLNSAANPIKLWY
jgi:hypothetical protein